MERAPRVDKVRDLPRSAHVGPVRELVPHFVAPSAHSNWYCPVADTELMVNISLLSDSLLCGRAAPACCRVAVTLVVSIRRFLVRIRGAWASSLIGKCRAYCEPIIIPPLEAPHLSDYSFYIRGPIVRDQRHLFECRIPQAA